MIYRVFVKLSWRARILEWFFPRRRALREARMRTEMRKIVDNPQLKPYFKD